jgi:hypothetical protein
VHTLLEADALVLCPCALVVEIEVKNLGAQTTEEVVEQRTD